MDKEIDESAVLARFRDGAKQLEKALEGLDEDGLDVPWRPGGWTIRQIVHHVVDGDDLWKVGIKAALGNEESEFTFDWYWSIPQDTWADRWRYAARPIGLSLSLFKANRLHVLELAGQVPGALQRTLNVRTLDGKVERLTV
ncbi:MAG: DinB family protein, partial [Candidatus Latescibacterota bacterium]